MTSARRKKSPSYYWGTAHVEPTSEEVLRARLAEAERLLELSSRENEAKEEKIAGLLQVIDTVRRDAAQLMAERDTARRRLDALTLGRGSSAASMDEVKSAGVIWQERYYSLSEQYAAVVRENSDLKKKLNIRNGKESLFGIGGSPTSNRDFKGNADEDNRAKRGGARRGHAGHGRRPAAGDSSRPETCSTIPLRSACCDASDLLKVGERRREYDRFIPARTEHVVVMQDVFWCRNCEKKLYARPGDILPKMSFSNSFLATAAVEVFVNGRTARQTAGMLGIRTGTFFGLESFLADLLRPTYGVVRLDVVRQKSLNADETSWWNDGKKGYAWVFTNPNVALHLFEGTRGSVVPASLFGYREGKYSLPEAADLTLIEECGKYEGPMLLVTDRYGGYSPVDVNRQFCFEHLKRDLDKLLARSAGIREVADFHDALRPLLAKSMSLCADAGRGDDEYFIEAGSLRENIHALVWAEARDCELRAYQNIWRDNWDSLFHWVSDRDVRCENNAAERAIRPTVIVRKLSFGSQSDRGAENREIIMSVLRTVMQRGKDPFDWLLEALNRLAADPAFNIADALPPTDAKYERKLKAENSA